MMKRLSLKTKVQIAICLFALTPPAFAVGSIIVATLVKAGTLVAGSFLAAFVQFAINFAVSTIVSRVFGKKPPKPVDNGVRQQVPPSSTNSIPVVYGDALLGGVFVDAVLTTDQKTMYYVMAISNISPNGQFTFDKTKFYYGDRLVTFDGTDKAKVISLTDGAGNVDTKINDNLWIYLYRSNEAGVITNLDDGGTAPASGSPDIIMSTANGIPAGLEWPATNRQMNGLAFAIIKLVYSRDDDATQLQPVTFYAKHNLNGTGVAKPGDVWLDYITNAKYGGAVGAIYASSSSATALNTYSDELITFTDSSGNPSTQPRYRINGVIDTGTNVLENIDNILVACDSWMAYNAPTGEWSIVINKAESPSLAFNDTNIIGDIRVSTIDINQSINQIEAKFPNKLNKDIPAYVFIQTPAPLLYPNEPVNKFTTEFSLVNDSVQAQYLANRILEQAREDLIVTLKSTYYGIQANAGDVVSVTNAVYGWNAKLFRVMKVNEAALEDGSLGAQIELNEYNAQVYDDKAITEFQPSPNSDLPAPQFFSALGTPTVIASRPTDAVPSFDVQVYIPVTGRVTFITLFYTTSASPSVNDWIQLYRVSLSNGQAFTNATNYTLLNQVLPAGTYYFGYLVGNAQGQTQISVKSAALVWTPTGQAGPTGPTGTSGATGPTGVSGSKTALVTLYQWSPVTPTNPSGTSTYTWSTASNGSYTGGGGWSVTIPANPGTPGTKLWSASKSIIAPAEDVTTTVSWASGYTVQDISENGLDGVQSATPTVYQWAVTIPSGPTGTSTYTWATNSFTPTPAGWTLTGGTSPSAGYTLWAARVNLVDASSATTSTINWTTASIAAVGYAGQNGPTGATGGAGLSARICFARVSGNPTPISGNITTSGSASYPSSAQSSSTWGFAATWGGTDPDPSSTNSLYQSDGIYNPATDQTTWSTPYISSLKVGTLSAITVNTGALTVQDVLTINSLGKIQGGQTGYNTGTGFFLGYSGGAYKFSIGSSIVNMLWDGSSFAVNGASINGGTIKIGTGDSPAGKAFEVLSNGVTYINALYADGIQSANTSFDTYPLNAISQRNFEAVLAQISFGNSGGNAHGVRGQNLTANTSGLVGAANGYDFYADGGGTNYGPFTGTHDSLVPIDTVFAVGDIVVDVQIVERNGVSSTISEVATSTSANQSNALGVVCHVPVPLETIKPAAFIEGFNPTTGATIMKPSYTVNCDIYDFMPINSVGEGQINVCGEGGDIAAGDLIVTSSTAGKGMKQSDNIVKSITVARARESVTFSSPTEVKMIACIYLSG